MPYPTPIVPYPAPESYPVQVLSGPYPSPAGTTGWFIYLLVALLAAGAIVGVAWFWRRKDHSFRPLGSAQSELPSEVQPIIVEASAQQPVQVLEPDLVQAGEPIQAEASIEEHIKGRFAGLKLGGWVTFLEGLAIGLVVLAFCSVFLDLGSSRRLPGNEAEIFQSLDWTLVHSLRQYGRFPLWNPYLLSGLPYIADPMLHVYNPLVTLPVLIFGVRDGFKIALFLSFLMAALGMWRLAADLGMGRPARIWAALMFAFAGQPVARFFQGEYLFVFGFAWIPWIILLLGRAVRTGRRLYMGLAALALALFFFCGNAYYPFLMLFVVAIFALVMIPRFSIRKPYLSLDRQRLVSLAITGCLSLGLASIQLFPLLQLWPRLEKGEGIYGAHTLRQIYLDYTSKDTLRPDAFSALPAREEYYAYIGIGPFLALSLLPLAIWKRERRGLIFLVLVVVFTVVWIDINPMPWRELYARTRFFSQFRHLLRPLIFGGLALILLAASGMDTAWKLLAAESQSGEASWKGRISHDLAFLGAAILGGFMLVSGMDLFATNQMYMRTVDTDPVAYQVTTWLRQHDPTDVYVRNNPNNAWHDAMISARLRFFEAWLSYNNIRVPEYSANQRPVEARPNYVIQSNREAPPPNPGTTLIQEIGDYNIYWLPNSLPFAFSVPQATLNQGSVAGELIRSDVTQQSWYTSGPNTVEVIGSSSQAGDVLVLMYTDYPGWQVKVDGRSRPLRSQNGYLATDMLTGVHKYEFAFRPASFYLGLVISLFCLGLSLYWIASDRQVSWSTARDRLQVVLARLRRLRWPALRDMSRGRLVTSAVYQQGLLQPAKPLDLPENQPVRLSVEMDLTGADQPRAAARRWVWATADLAGALSRTTSLAAVLFGLGLAVYMITRLVRLADFPIYFFSDEAYQTLFAQRLIENGFRDASGTWFPIYIEAAAARWTPLFSIYIHAISLTLFGKSILVTRGTSAVVSVLAALSVSLVLKQVFKVRSWWAGVLLVAITPAWFLHSRTAFETVMMVAFYGCFVWFYLLYRCRSPRYLYLAILSGAAAFYTYSNGQAVLAVAAGMLFLSDLRYHLQQRRTLLNGLLLTLVLAIPFLLFRFKHPEAMGETLRVINSYWVMSIPLGEKLSLFAQKYAYGLSPQYWFFPNSQDLIRHRMAGFGQMQTAVLPLFLIGLVLCLRRFRSAPHRAVLLTTLATPVGAALLDVGIPRVLSFIIPANILAGLGLEWIFERLGERFPRRLAEGAIFLILAWASFAMLQIALVRGPLWFRDYGLYGMQYGARQLFEQAIPAVLRRDANTQVLVSSIWANGSDLFIQYFLSPEQQQRVRMDGVESFLYKKEPLDQSMLFVMSPPEYQEAIASPKFKEVKVEQILPYPDGTPGFYFARLAYADNVDQFFAAELETRRQLLASEVVLGGQVVKLRYSQIDMGSPELMFDGDTYTLMRGLDANPFILEMDFPQPRSLSGLEADFGLVDLNLTVQLFSQVEDQPVTYQITRRNVTDPWVKVAFDKGPEQVVRMHLEMLNLLSGEVANIHIRELKLLP